MATCGKSMATAATRMNDGETGSERWFTTTHWSVVLLAGGKDAPEATAALEELCRNYWYPLYAYVRRRGYGAEDAQDLTQEFFVRLLRREDLAHADPHKGRFRSYLLKSLNHFLAHQWRREHTLRRGGGKAVVSLDDETAELRYARELASEATPETLYNRRWALTLFDRALARLQAEAGAAGKDRQFAAFKRFLSNPAEEGEYALLAQELKTSPGSIAAAVHRLRQRYAELVRDEIAHTVASRVEVEEELQHLLSAMV